MSDKITYIFSSRSRPQKFVAAMENIINFSDDKNFEVIGVFDDEDETMTNTGIIEVLFNYENLKTFYGKSKGKIGSINRELGKISADTKIVVCMSDDMVFIKEGFDNDIRAAFADGFCGLAHFGDQIQKERLCTCPIMHIDYLKLFGYIFNPAYQSLYADKELQRVAKSLGKYKFIDIDILEHHHVLWGYDTATGEKTQHAKPDKLMEQQSSTEMYDADRKVYLKNKNLAIVTSLAVSHINKENQISAIRSWKEIGEIYSLNSREEIDQLKQNYEGVEFIETVKTFKHLMGRPLVAITAMIDFAIQEGKDMLLINSDIILHNFPDQLKEDGITIFSRYDYTVSFIDCKKFEMGWDAFFVPNEFLHIFTPTNFALGAAWFDYEIPLRAILNNVRVYWPQEKYALHKEHATQYNIEEWFFVGEHFRWQHKIDKILSIPEIAMKYLAEIKSKLIII